MNTRQRVAVLEQHHFHQKFIFEIDETADADAVMADWDDAPVIVLQVPRRGYEPAWPGESYPQADYPVDKSDRIADKPVDKSQSPVMTIELDAGDDLNSVAAELNISADELHRQIQSGLVKIIDPIEKLP